MIVPQYWAEARIQRRFDEKQITVRRFGWSDASQEEAQAHAEERVREAFQRVEAGEKLPRREPKVAYNGATGVPIPLLHAASPPSWATAEFTIRPRRFNGSTMNCVDRGARCRSRKSRSDFWMESVRGATAFRPNL